MVATCKQEEHHGKMTYQYLYLRFLVSSSVRSSCVAYMSQLFCYSSLVELTQESLGLPLLTPYFFYVKRHGDLFLSFNCHYETFSCVQLTAYVRYAAMNTAQHKIV